MKKIEYDASKPISRLEKGDKAIIEFRRHSNSYEEVRKRKDKYIDIQDGKYEAICIKPFYLKCIKYPELSGAYNEWIGNKRGSSKYRNYSICADELIK